MADWIIKNVVCTRAAPAGQFAVVELANASYAIAIDGECLQVFTWHAGQLPGCVDFMLHLASRSTSPQSTRAMSHAEDPSAAA